MNKFWIIVAHTYLNKLKTKSFIITTAITVLLLLGITNLDTIIKAFDNDEQTTVGVLSESEETYSTFKENMKLIDEDLALKEIKSESEAKKQVKDEEIEGYLQLSINSEELPQGVYKSNSLAESAVATSLQQGLQQMKVAYATQKVDLDPQQIEEIYSPVAFEKEALVDNAKTEEELSQARGLVYVLLFVIYFSVIMYGSMIAMEVATEKSSRVMEILVSSVSPVKQMFAKIAGIALLSLTQFTIIAAVGYMSLQGSSSELSDFLGFSDVPIQTFVYAFVFFILGYLLFATLAAFLGSLVSRIEDVQQMITPMTLVIVAAFMIAMFGLGKPEASFITITSFIPFFAPMIMFLRVGMLTVPVWEIALSIGLLVATIGLLAVFGARVYRGGVLMYGKSSSFKDIKKALQLTKKESIKK
ncbi:ABC transporter permease [Priestia flexa]|jgi:ABC-2 type transport system permease protein|uniref:ABC transporter permease n=1 Tax=Priestia flexa TaxID=86664 RepID=A0A8I1MJN5_9BACI|nr:ABC transporter permease [Priestia flexa]MBN8253561.1 ABC transporter permease [Priestia flexa]MBN8435556.1 ABC transporter permease [Priestia flexa]MCA0968114.1 ABC transporter permease [Priestia flexa]RIV04516.1 ABC transporter permease [Priestia flexa]UIR30562.1 ABC transporter permease [Priestia flexa]